MNIPADTDVTGVLSVVGSLVVDNITIDNITIERTATGDMTVRAGTNANDQVIIGREGDVEMGGSTLSTWYPFTDEKVDFGKATNRVNNIHCVGLIPKSRIAWTLTGSPSTDRVKTWADGSVTNAEFCTLVLDLQNAGVL